MKSRSQSLIIAAVCVVLTSAVADADEVVIQAEQLPPRVNLQRQFEKYGLTAPQQGQRGACQVFAMTGVLEYQLASRGERSDLSEQFIMWAANEATGFDRVEGFNPDLLIAGLQRFGICDESLMTYVPRNEALAEPSADALENARTRRECELLSIKHWSSDIGFSAEHIDQICRQLAKGRPVTATLCWPAGLNDREIVDGRRFLVRENIDGTSKDGHGVTLVGYRFHERFDGGGYFIFRNSWGPNFADNGYARVTFEYATEFGIDAYVVSFR